MEFTSLVNFEDASDIKWQLDNGASKHLTKDWRLVMFHKEWTSHNIFFGSDWDHMMLVQHESSLDCVFSFSGTNQKAEVYTSLKSESRQWCDFRTHKGYADELWTVTNANEYQTGPDNGHGDSIKTMLGKCNRVIMAGHSLGGAMASIFAACINTRNVGQAAYEHLAWDKRASELMPEI